MKQIFGALLCSVISVGAAHAGDEQGQDERVSATVVNLKEEGAALFRIQGTTDPFPDGTRLFVTLQAKGRVKDVVCALFQVEVRGNRFTGEQVWPGRTFAPLMYEATVQLLVEKQPEAIRKWLMREYGFVHVHKEEIDRREIGMGTLEERTAYARESLVGLQKLVEELEELRKAGLALTLKPATTEVADELTGLNRRILEYRGTLDRFKTQHVVFLEQGLFDGTLNVLQSLGDMIMDYAQGETYAHQGIGALGSRVKRLRRILEDRLPAREAKPLDHPDEDASKEDDHPDEDASKEDDHERE